jgi:hypothetical protein
MKKYNVEFKVEQIYNVEVETESDHSSPDFEQDIFDLIIEDYHVGNMDKDEPEKHYFLKDIREKTLQ